MKRAEMLGSQFGRWLVMSDSKNKDEWHCLCQCGKFRPVLGNNLRAGRTASCGCLRADLFFRHGASKTPTYASWRSMISRCTNPNDPSFSRYAGIGVTVAAEWLNYDTFFLDMGERPHGFSIDRINPFGNYSKDNCRWATKKEQVRNQRRAPPLIETPHGQMRACDAAEISGIRASTLKKRSVSGWPADRLFDPVLNRRIARIQGDPA